jgi:hypothetical protein
MRRLSRGTREALSDKLFDLGNLAAASLVFGYFISDKPLPFSTLILGIMTTSLAYGMAAYLKNNL